MHLNVIHLSAATDPNQRDAVDLVAGRELVTAFSDDHVAEYPAAVVGVIAPGKTRFTFGIDITVTSANRAPLWGA